VHTLYVVPSEKEPPETPRGAATATIRTWPALLAQFDSLARSHQFGPSQSTQYLVTLGVEIRQALGERWHELAALADKEKLTPGALLGRLVLEALDEHVGQDSPGHKSSHLRRTK